MTDINTVYVGENPRIAVDYSGAGPLVMFLHGVGFSRLDWHDQLADFAPQFTAAAWDARGHHGSADYDGPFNFSDVCDDLVRVLDRFGSDRTHLVGHSMGGRCVLEFQSRFPDRVKSVTFAGTSAKRVPPISDAERAQRRARRVDPLRGGLDLAEFAVENARRYLAPGAPPELFARVVARLTAMRRDSYAKTLDTIVTYTDYPDYADVRAPCLVITGDQDPQATPDFARWTAAQIPGARLEIVANSGHMVNMEQAAAFSAAVLDFVRDCEGRRG